MTSQLLGRILAVGLSLTGAVTSVGVYAEDALAPEATIATAAAHETAPAKPAAEAEPAPTINKGDTAFMLICTLLVIMMAVPGLALFYGGMVRQKNALSVLMQVFVVFSLMTVLWCIYGYSVAFTGSGMWFGGLDRLFLSGITADSRAPTFTAGVAIPEFVYIAFQCGFAALAPCLIVGAFAERMKFAAVLLFCTLWFTFSYLPIARMVWYTEGYLFKLGALDFAGGTVVHINAGIAGLLGAILCGRRLGYGTTMMPPHSLPMVMIGAALLWIGWFGFNVGSNLEANPIAGLVFLNTFVATAAAVCAWISAEWVLRGTPTMLGAASGAIAGLVAITPACGYAGPMGSIILGIVAGLLCLWAVSNLKGLCGYDDSLDVFGVHCVGGILGALATAIVAAPGLGGIKGDDYNVGAQFMIQLTSVIITLVWSGVVSIVGYKIAEAMVGLRVTEDVEREGLDTVEHGERAYVS